MKKNFLYSTLFSLVFLLGFSASAFAVTSLSVVGNDLTCTGDTYCVIVPDIDYATNTNAVSKLQGTWTPVTFDFASFSSDSSYLVIACDGSDYLNCNNFPMSAGTFRDLLSTYGSTKVYTTTTSFSLTAPVVVPPVGGGSSVGIKFLQTVADDGNDGASNLLTATVVGTGTTVGSFTPTLAVVGGIILAMIAIRFIIKLFYDANPNKKTKEKKRI